VAIRPVPAARRRRATVALVRGRSCGRDEVVTQGVPVVLNQFAIAVMGLILLAVLPLWPWSRGWGWAPAGMIAMGMATVVVFSLTVVPE
jgi:hypothetical protein